MHSKTFSKELLNNEILSFGGRKFTFRVISKEDTPELMTWCQDNDIIFDVNSDYELADDQYELSNQDGTMVVFDVRACISTLNTVTVPEINMMKSNGVEFVHDNEESLSQACSKGIFKRLFSYLRREWNLVSVVMEARNGIENIGIFELKDQCSDQTDKIKYARDIMLKGFMKGSIGMAQVLETIEGITLKTPQNAST